MASSQTSPAAVLRAVALWLGPRVEPGHASIGLGLAWYATLLVALRAGAATFGVLLAVIAVFGAQQAVVIRSGAGVGPAGSDSNKSTPSQASISPRHSQVSTSLSAAHRFPAAALAGAVAVAGVIDTRLAGAVIAAAIGTSFVVVAMLRPGRKGAPALLGHDRRTGMLARAAVLMRTWLHVGVAAACAAAVARHSLGAALVLVTATGAYDAGAYLTGAGRPPGFRSPLVGVFTAAVVIFACTGASVPPFAPSDALRFAIVAAFTLPLSTALARPVTAGALDSRPVPAHLQDASGTGPSQALAPKRRRIGGLVERRVNGNRFNSEWAVRRLDSMTLTALGWMWGLGLIAI